MWKVLVDVGLVVYKLLFIDKNGFFLDSCNE